MIRFGTKSIVLLLGAVHGVVVLCLLLCIRKNKPANRLLAALLLFFVLRITPYIIGFAGYYDAYPWLSFSPLDITFAFGPLVYLYIRVLTAGSAPRKVYALLLPAVVQFLYYSVIFLQPLAFKNNWDDRIQVPYLNPVESVIALTLLTGGWLASIRRYRAYRQWVNENVSNGEDLRLDWIRYFLIALGATLAVWAGFELTEWLYRPLTYLQRFPLYVWQMLLVYYLGTEGWRNATRDYPHPADAASLPLREALPPGKATLRPTERDWTVQGAEWRQTVLERSLWSDPEITLATLTRQLGTNTSHLSRALNEGLGQNFNEFINRLRVEAVSRQLAEPTEARDLLDLAFAAGFSSKASFNRCFKLYTGLTPTEFRRNPPAARLKS